MLSTKLNQLSELLRKPFEVILYAVAVDGVHDIDMLEDEILTAACNTYSQYVTNSINVCQRTEPLGFAVISIDREFMTDGFLHLADTYSREQLSISARTIGVDKAKIADSLSKMIA